MGSKSVRVVPVGARINAAKPTHYGKIEDASAYSTVRLVISTTRRSYDVATVYYLCLHS